MSKQKNKLKVLVLGGNGFVGSQIVTHLAGKADVVVGTRRETPQENQLTIRMQSMLTVDAWKDALKAFDVVINSVGILRERKGESYNDVHNVAVANLAQACVLSNVRLLHISAIGLSTRARSRFIRSKLAGEQAITASGANATIIRPSLLDGEGGFGAVWFRRVASWPIQFVMRSEGLVAPLQVSDLGEAVAKLVLMPAKIDEKIVELGGANVYSIPEYLKVLRKTKGLLPALQIAVPKWAVRLASHMLDILAWTPLSFGHYELMQGYNVPSVNLLPVLIGRRPSALGKPEEAKEGVVILRS